MRRFALAALAFSFLAAPAAYAGAMPAAQPDIAQMKTAAPKAEEVRWVRRGFGPGPAWRIGRPYPFWPRLIVRDFVRYGLRAPGPGMAWVRAGDQFLLVRTGTGVVVAVR
jgi:Ni/Co efflux regulator RcnB